MKLSIVSTLYRTAPHLEEFCRRAGVAARRLAADDYEIVLVNDGSPDNSLELAISLHEADSHMVVIDLSRNFGHHKAMMTGLAHARGEQVFLIDSDLEEKPEWLLSFAEQMGREQPDVVYGVQARRKGGIFERWSGFAFYRLLRLLTRLDLPDNIVVARLMTRRFVNALLQHDEREVFMAGLWVITGFAQRPQVITKTDTSPTTYTFRRKVSQLVNSVTSFSNAPLTGIFYIGVIISLLAVTYTGYLFVNRLFFFKPLVGWTSVMASIWLLGGFIISFIGIVGIYLSKVFSETKRRPYTVVRQIYRQQSKKEGP
jgi:putative glycosyltransferase